MTDFKIEVTIRDVTKGDIASVYDHLLYEVGPDFDAAHGDFTIHVAQRETGSSAWFPVEMDEE